MLDITRDVCNKIQLPDIVVVFSHITYWPEMLHVFAPHLLSSLISANMQVSSAVSTSVKDDHMNSDMLVFNSEKYNLYYLISNNSD